MLADYARLRITRHPVWPYHPRMWELRHNLGAYDAAYHRARRSTRLRTADRRRQAQERRRASRDGHRDNVTRRLCEMLGIERQVVQAPMAAIPPLAAAVSNAGALAMVTLTWSDDAGAVVRETVALTPRPSGGNLVLAEGQHHRLDQALEAGLRIVSFMWGIPVATSSRYTTPGASPCSRQPQSAADIVAELTSRL
jgi:hypothetical protein